MKAMEQMVGSEEATPEEEQQYEQAMAYAMESLHTGKVAKNTVGRVLNAESISKGIAEAVFVLLRRTEVKMDGLEDSVKIQIGEDLVMEVLTVLVEAERIKEPEINEQLIEDVVKQLYTMYSQDAEQRGELDPKVIEEDLNSIGKPSGMNAMSNKEVSQRGLMNV